MASINKVILVGRLGKDPEVKSFGTDGRVASFSLATSEKFKEKESTEWHNVTVFGKLADLCGQYIHKGSLVYVEGRLRTESYEKEGQKHWSTKVIGDTIQFLDSKPSQNEIGPDQPRASASQTAPEQVPDLPF